jgi:hypothetical protein
MIKLSNNSPLQPGDKIRIELRQRFSLGSTLDSYVLASRIEAIQRKQPGYTITGWTYVKDGLDITAVVNSDYGKPGIVQAGVVTPAVIVTAIVGITAVMVSASAYLITDTAADVLQNPQAASVVNSVSQSAALSVLAIAAVLIYYWSKKK